jgi:hypothetical protein
VSIHFFSGTGAGIDEGVDDGTDDVVGMVGLDDVNREYEQAFSIYLFHNNTS